MWVEMYARRRACRVAKASRVFGLDRKTVRMLSFSVPPGYRRGKPPRRPKLGPFTFIDRILEDDRTSHHKQRHTAKRIFDRLRDEYGFTGGYTIVKDYVRERRLRSREMFVPLVHSPGHAQADFGEAMAVIGGVARKVHLLAFDLPHSDACFVKAWRIARRSAITTRRLRSSAVPRSILYEHQAAQSPASWAWEAAANASGRNFNHYLFEDRFGRPGQRKQGRGTGRLHPAELLSPSELRGPQRCLAGQCRRRGCGVTRRPSASASHGTGKPSCLYPRHHTMPATSALDFVAGALPGQRLLAAWPPRGADPERRRSLSLR